MKFRSCIWKDEDNYAEIADTAGSLSICLSDTSSQVFLDEATVDKLLIFLQDWRLKKYRAKPCKKCGVTQPIKNENDLNET